MNRLTWKMSSGIWGVKGIEWKDIPGEIVAKLYGPLSKLKDYEDTGITPQEMELVGGLYAELHKKLDKINQKIKEISDWVSVEDYLPEEPEGRYESKDEIMAAVSKGKIQEYMVTIKDFAKPEILWYLGENVWCDIKTGWTYAGALAWRRLPNIYVKEK